MGRGRGGGREARASDCVPHHPHPRGFAGLKPGDRWCLCAPRWAEALEADKAPKVVLRSTHFGALQFCTLEDLKRFAVDLS